MKGRAESLSYSTGTQQFFFLHFLLCDTSYEVDMHILNLLSTANRPSIHVPPLHVHEIPMNEVDTDILDLLSTANRSRVYGSGGFRGGKGGANAPPFGGE